jgi:hypothetical protein
MAKDIYELRVFAVEDASLLALLFGDFRTAILLTRFLKAFRKAFKRDPQAFFNLSAKALGARGSVFAIVIHKGRVVAGARGVLRGGSVYIGQCFTEPAYRGRRLIGRAILGIREHFYSSTGIAHAHLVARVIGDSADGSVVRAYRRIGFVARGVEESKINPRDRSERHLLETAHEGGILKVLAMTASPETLLGFVAQAA